MQLKFAYDLALVQQEFYDRIDDACGKKRSEFITIILGQDQAYISKRLEAEKYLSAANPNINDYQYVKAEAEATGTGYAYAAQSIIDAANAYMTRDAKIERIRRAVKVGIASYNTAEGMSSMYHIYKNNIIALAAIS